MHERHCDVVVCSGGMLIVVRVVHLHDVHLPRLLVDVSDNGTQLIEVLKMCTLWHITSELFLISNVIVLKYLISRWGSLLCRWQVCFSLQRLCLLSWYVYRLKYHC